MEALIIDATDETPQVLLDSADGKFEFTGKSLPEDVAGFYNPILDWLDQYAESPNDSSNFVFKLDYFNTASSKLILDILLKLEEINEEDGKEVLITWYYDEDDEDMEEAGEEYSDMVDIEFKLIPMADES